MNDINEECPRFYGKYRGVVTDNKDPNGLGRIRVMVRDVLGDKDSGWAMPCVPYAGKGVGLYLIPPENAFVWVEFEHGDSDYPIWCGCFWAPGEVPVSPATGAEMKVLKTDAATITINDQQGAQAVTIESANGQKIELSTSGIKIENGNGATIELSQASVKLNDQALEVT